MNSINIERKLICVRCIDEKYLRDHIPNESQINECDYCPSSDFTITIKHLVELVHEAMGRHFELTPSDPNEIQSWYLRWGYRTYWERQGESVVTIVSKICGIGDKIANDVVELLSHRFDYIAVKYGEEAPYGDDAHYQETDFRYDPLNEMWQEFCSVAQHKSRFFDPLNAEILSVMFGGLQKLQSYSNREFMVEIGAEQGKSQIWRARYAANHKDIERILENPYDRTGPPPSLDAKNGRMNPRGISVFYGSTEPETCISEIRAPVGAYVVLACFEPLRRLKLLDLCALVEAPVIGSVFDEDFIQRKRQSSFLTSVVREMSRPIMPEDEDLQYIPTQMVAEYLKNSKELNLDGLIFPSTQTRTEGTNLLLFNGSCRVETPSNSRVAKNKVMIGPEYDFDIQLGESVETGREEVYVQSQLYDKTEVLASKYPFFGEVIDETIQELETLRFIPEMTKVLRVTEIKPSWDELKMEWYCDYS